MFPQKLLSHEAPIKGKSASPLRGTTVLIADDNPGQRARLRELYESFGCRIVGEAADGEAVLAKLEDVTPDLISLDVLMPVMHGMETLLILRKRKHPSKIMLVTALGHVSGVANEGGISYQADAVCAKKDTAEEFHETMCGVLGLGEAADTGIPAAVPSEEVVQAAAGGRR